MARGQGQVKAELQAQRGRQWEPWLVEAGLGEDPSFSAPTAPS